MIFWLAKTELFLAKSLNNDIISVKHGWKYHYSVQTVGIMIFWLAKMEFSLQNPLIMTYFDETRLKISLLLANSRNNDILSGKNGIIPC